MKYTENLYKEARMVAIKAHSNQSYDGIYPYEKHTDDVVNVLIRYGYSGKYIIAGYLHDTMEDNGLSYNKILRHFGLDIAEMVYGVTDELGRTREEKKVKTLPKTASNPDAIIVKLADRIANLEHGGKIGMYASEQEEFKKWLFPQTPKEALSMWDRIEELLNK